MARYYDCTFRTPAGLVTIRSCGNTKLAAERRAWRELRVGRQLDVSKCSLVSVHFAAPGLA